MKPLWEVTVRIDILADTTAEAVEVARTMMADALYGGECYRGVLSWSATEAVEIR